MIVTEHYKTRSDGVVLNRTYSNIGMMIEREGVQYSEAIDPVDSGREYTETNVPIDGYTDEATEADYQSALAEFGVRV